jgi:hypothetical protein
MEMKWVDFIKDYLSNSQEFLFHYKEKDIWLCWSGNEDLPYAVNVIQHDKRLNCILDLFTHSIKSKNKNIIQYQEFKNQQELLHSFVIDGKTIEELWEELS